MLQVFNYNNQQVRTIDIDGEPWFVAKDVAEILGYENPTKAIRDHVDDVDKQMGVQNVTPSIQDNLGREQYPTWINECGLYSLVMSSRLPGARQFRRFHYVDGKTGEDGSRVSMKWTQKGRMFLYSFLKEQDILPVMEREAA